MNNCHATGVFSLRYHIDFHKAQQLFNDTLSQKELSEYEVETILSGSRSVACK